MSGRLREELRKYLIVSAYLYVCFGALLLYKAALLSGSGTHTLSHRILQRSVLLLLLLVLLTIIEEIVVGRVHGHSLAQTLAEFSEKSLPHVLATCLVLLLVLMPLVAVEEINRALGPGVLHKLVFGATSGEHNDDVRRPGNTG